MLLISEEHFAQEPLQGLPLIPRMKFTSSIRVVMMKCKFTLSAQRIFRTKEVLMFEQRQDKESEIIAVILIPYTPQLQALISTLGGIYGSWMNEGVSINT